MLAAFVTDRDLAAEAAGFADSFRIFGCGWRMRAKALAGRDVAFVALSRRRDCDEDGFVDLRFGFGISLLFATSTFGTSRALASLTTFRSAETDDDRSIDSASDAAATDSLSDFETGFAAGEGLETETFRSVGFGEFAVLLLELLRELALRRSWARASLKRGTVC